MTPDEDRQQKLDQAVAAFQQAREAGDDPKAADWIERYPDLAPELEEHFQMDGLVGWVADADVPRAPASGTMFGPYRILRVIGRGGAGIVYEADHASTGLRVALKVLPSCVLSDPRQAERFRREIEVLAALDHPHILPILDSGEYGGIPYFAMPKVEGLDLRAIVRQLRRASNFTRIVSRIGCHAYVPVSMSPADRQAPGHAYEYVSMAPESRAIKGTKDAAKDPSGNLHLGGPSTEHARAVAAIGLQVAGALDYAHKQGVIHRDVKPSNLLLDSSGTVFITDFGLAHAPDRDELTETGDLAGTLRYLPPERLRGWSDPRSDVYSLGLSLYELVTLHPAFDAIDRSRLIRAIAQDTPHRPRSWNREIPRDLETIIRKAIEREPSHRYQSAAAMADDLRRFLEGEPIRARRVNTLRRAWSWSRRNKRKAGAIAFVAVSLVGMVASAFWVEHIRRSTAESSAKESQFQAELLQIEKSRTGEHLDGWSSKVMELALKASNTHRDERLRDQAAASLAGLDVTDRDELLPGIGGSSVAFNADGSRLLIGGCEPGEKRDGHAQIYDVRSKRITHVSKQVGPGPVAFTKSGKALQLMRVEEIGLCLWNVAENRLETQFQESPAEVPAILALSPNGTQAAAAIRVAGKPTIRIWDGATGRVLRDLPGEATALTFSPGCERLAAGTDRGEVRVWSPCDGWSSMSQGATGNRIQALSFTRDPRRDAEGNQGWLLAVGDAGAEIVILDLSARTARARCFGSRYEVTSVAFTSDGTILFSGGRHAARLWDAATGSLLLHVFGGDSTSGIDLSAHGDRLAISYNWIDTSPRVDVWKLEQGRGIATLRGLTGPISKVALSPDGRRLAALSHDWRIGAWDLEDGRLIGILEGPRGLFADNAALAFGPDGRRLAVSSGRSAQLWDLDPIRQAHLPWEFPPGLGDTLAFRSPSELLLCRFECVDGVSNPFGNDFRRFPRVIQVRNLLGNVPLRGIRTIPGYQRLNSSVASPDGQVYVLNLIREGPDYDRHVVMSIESRTGESVWRHELRQPVRSGMLMMDPRGSLVGSDAEPAPDRQSFMFLRLADGNPAPINPSIAPRLMPCAMAPGGRIFILACSGAMGSSQPILQLQRPESESAILRLGIDGRSDLSSVMFDREGRRIVWGQEDGTINVCDLAEVHDRLGSLSDLSEVVEKKNRPAAVKSR